MKKYLVSLLIIACIMTMVGCNKVSSEDSVVAEVKEVVALVAE